MRALFIYAAIIGGTVGGAIAQEAPHDFSQDTPPVPGQIVYTQRQKFRLAPLPLRAEDSSQLGLPVNGPKGVVRESLNEPRYTPSTDRR